jgi:hypothetical protein
MENVQTSAEFVEMGTVNMVDKKQIVKLVGLGAANMGGQQIGVMIVGLGAANTIATNTYATNVVLDTANTEPGRCDVKYVIQVVISRS